MADAVQGASWLPFAWQAQYTEPPGGAAARVGAAGPRLPFAWQAQYTEPPKELRRAWAPLGRGWLRVASAIHGASWLPFAWQAQYTEPPGGAAARVGAAGPRLAFVWQAQYTEPPEGAAARVGAAGPQLASRGRRSAESFLAAFRVAGTVHRASCRSCGACGRGWAAAGFTWQAQYTELPGCFSREGAVHKAS